MLIQYSITLKALNKFVEGYNAQQDCKSKQVRGSMLHTAKELIRIYGVSLLKSNKIKPVTAEDIPSLRTNNIQLGKLTKMSGRTIQRHIRRLQDAGIITDKIGHGSNSSYELWINPKILWIKGVTTLKTFKKDVSTTKSLSTEKQIVKNNHSTKCPHTDTRDYTRDKINILIPVEKLRRVWQESTAKIPLFTGDVTGDATGDTQLKDLKKKDTQLKENWRGHNPTEKQIVGGRQTQLTTSEGVHATGDKDPTRHSFLVSYVEELWKLAQEKLYAGTSLTKNQHKTAIQLLHQWYRPVSTEKLAYVHQVYKTRIEIVQKYIQKDPSSRFVTLPYLYFDPKNKHGFTGTKSWYEKEKAHKKRLEYRKILREQIQKFKRNMARDTAESRPLLTVYRECEQRIGKLGIPELLQEFYAEVLGKKVKNKLFNF